MLKKKKSGWSKIRAVFTDVVMAPWRHYTFQPVNQNSVVEAAAREGWDNRKIERALEVGTKISTWGLSSSSPSFLHGIRGMPSGLAIGLAIGLPLGAITGLSLGGPIGMASFWIGVGVSVLHARRSEVTLDSERFKERIRTRIAKRKLSIEQQQKDMLLGRSP